MITRQDFIQFLRVNVDLNIYEKRFTSYKNWNKKNEGGCSSTVRYEFPCENILKIFFNSTIERERHEKNFEKEKICAFEMKKKDWKGMLEFGIFLKCDYLNSSENFFEVKITSFIQLKTS